MDATSANRSQNLPSPVEDTSPPAIESFIARWAKSGASERANYQLFLSELCTILGVPLPDPATPDDHEHAYIFERHVSITRSPGGSASSPDPSSTKKAEAPDSNPKSKILLRFHRSLTCFVLETKQGVEDKAALSDIGREREANAKKGQTPSLGTMSEQLKQRMRTFALDAICLCADLPHVIETRNAIGQVIRSSSSVAVNYRAACRGKSTADFISKLGTVEEEADESGFWLGMLRDIAKRRGLQLDARTLGELQRLEGEAGELLAITVSSRKTARNNAQIRNLEPKGLR